MAKFEAERVLKTSGQTQSHKGLTHYERHKLRMAKFEAERRLQQKTRKKQNKAKMMSTVKPK